MSPFDLSYFSFLDHLPAEMGDELHNRMARGENHPFPRGLKASRDTNIVYRALRDSFRPLDPNDGGLLTLEQRGQVVCGSQFLLLACLMFIEEYINPMEGGFDCLSRLLALEWSTVWNPSRSTSLCLQFKEIETGQHADIVNNSIQWVPSTLRRNSDGLRPYDNVKPDGRRGLDPRDEPMLKEWGMYGKHKRYFEKRFPHLNYSLLVKRTLMPFCPEATRDKAFTELEAECNELFDQTAYLHKRYVAASAPESAANGKIDLLDRLMAEAIFKFLQDERRDVEARQAYVGRLTQCLAQMG